MTTPADASRLNAAWTFPTAVRFGAGRIADLGRTGKRLGMARPLVVSDPGLASTSIPARAIALLEDVGLAPALFTDVKSNPSAVNVAAGAQAFRNGGHDGVIALGGGSAMDAAKAISLAAGHDGAVLDFAHGGPRYKDIRGDAIAPLVAVPTTSGTGSEMGYAAVITDEAANAKRILYHTGLLPRAVICDPELVVGLPADLTAWTGMDAAVHCLEAYCARMFHPMCDGIAAEGLRIIRAWLPRAVRDGGDVEARAQMMAAAAMGAVAFNKGLGAVHALSHAIGARFDSHHGLTNAVVLPYVLAHNRLAIESRLEGLATYMGMTKRGFAGLMDWTLNTRAAFAIPHTVAGLGVTEADLDALAETAAADVTARENPVPVDAKALRGILAEALAGRIG